MTSNRRRYNRLLVHQYSFHVDRKAEMHLLNISFSGVLIKTTLWHDLGDEIRVVSPSSAISFPAIVVRKEVYQEEESPYLDCYYLLGCEFPPWMDKNMVVVLLDSLTTEGVVDKEVLEDIKQNENWALEMSSIQ